MEKYLVVNSKNKAIEEKNGGTNVPYRDRKDPKLEPMENAIPLTMRQNKITDSVDRPSINENDAPSSATNCRNGTVNPALMREVKREPFEKVDDVAPPTIRQNMVKDSIDRPPINEDEYVAALTLPERIMKGTNIPYRYRKDPKLEPMEEVAPPTMRQNMVNPAIMREIKQEPVEEVMAEERMENGEGDVGLEDRDFDNEQNNDTGDAQTDENKEVGKIEDMVEVDSNDEQVNEESVPLRRQSGRLAKRARTDGNDEDLPFNYNMEQNADNDAGNEGSESSEHSEDEVSGSAKRRRTVDPKSTLLDPLVKNATKQVTAIVASIDLHSTTISVKVEDLTYLCLTCSTAPSPVIVVYREIGSCKYVVTSEHNGESIDNFAENGRVDAKLMSETDAKKYACALLQKEKTEGTYVYSTVEKMRHIRNMAKLSGTPMATWSSFTDTHLKEVFKQMKYEGWILRLAVSNSLVFHGICSCFSGKVPLVFKVGRVIPGYVKDDVQLLRQLKKFTQGKNTSPEHGIELIRAMDKCPISRLITKKSISFDDAQEFVALFKESDKMLDDFIEWYSNDTKVIKNDVDYLRKRYHVWKTAQSSVASTPAFECLISEDLNASSQNDVYKNCFVISFSPPVSECSQAFELWLPEEYWILVDGYTSKAKRGWLSVYRDGQLVNKRDLPGFFSSVVGPPAHHYNMQEFCSVVGFFCTTVTIVSSPTPLIEALQELVLEYQQKGKKKERRKTIRSEHGKNKAKEQKTASI